ncbi:Dolichyl-diphosphooligosaccharide--protein glycotransferase [Zostera marina]|uniref:Dolichyl-diphosphooligosaccharide--protein glycosyltransferase 48 kDa subunit n=1 Tax=Zostera marina TaxID=29655 RepID=A0A0K9PSA9_ZOSMR|nr:Dolichyl-diphosphooligosaccharide--protein glycotransferase [Zostera marina]
MAMAKVVRVSLSLISFLLMLLSPAASIGQSDGPRSGKILVVVDDFAIRSSHSIFFNSLLDRGFNLDFKLADDPSISLQSFGNYQYDGLVIFSPSAKQIGRSLTSSGVLEFVDSGRDLILAADLHASDFIREIATECGADFDEDRNAVVIDHTSYAVSDAEGDHTLIASEDILKSVVFFGEKEIEAPVLFRGIAHTLNPANNMAVKVLSASPSAYSANPNGLISKSPGLSGSTISLVSTVQARNNARMLVSGSLDLFSNRFFKSNVQKSGSSTSHKIAGNEQFVTEISKWVFHERGHLKAVNVTHHKIGEIEEPSMYRIKDDSVYSVEIYEWSGTSWEPYVADDVQLQFYMMSPYVLKTLSTDQKGVYSTTFKVPDVYGVFQFKVEYQRLGYTSLSLSEQIPVRPFKHNEYERFLTAAYPYYGAAFSSMTGFFLFTVVYLYNK